MHKLALRLGRTVKELSASLDVDELVQWVAFDQLCPIGDDVMDYFFANLCGNVVSALGAKKTGGGDFAIKDFLILPSREKPKTARELMQAMFGHRVVKGKPKGDRARGSR